MFFSARFSLIFLLAVMSVTFAQAQAQRHAQQKIDLAFIREEEDNFFIDLTDAAATFRDVPLQPETSMLWIHSYDLSYKKGSLTILHNASGRYRCFPETELVDALENIKKRFARTRKSYVLLSEQNDERGGFTIRQLTYQTPKKGTLVYKQYLACAHLYLLSGRTSAPSTETDDPVIRAINSFALKSDK
jgi:hypothetical protein